MSAEGTEVKDAPAVDAQTPKAPATRTVQRGLSKSTSEMIRLAARVRDAQMQEANATMQARMELIRVEQGVPADVRYEIVDTDDPTVLAVKYEEPIAPLALVKDA